MSISKIIETYMQQSSWIRKMFEEGGKLKAQFGKDNVYDFSLGNPNLAPPKVFRETLLHLIEEPLPMAHAYMPNAGDMEARDAIAAYVSTEQDISLTANEIIMTCGAAGGLNVVFKTLLEPGDEVIVPSPYFVEYGFYVSNHQGTLQPVNTHSDFSLNIEAIAEKMNSKTKAVLINSPNNPTGRLYSKEQLMALGELLREKSNQLNRTLYLITDEPYRKIVFDKKTVPSVFSCYTETIFVTSYSKDLSIPGERIGFIAVHPQSTHKNRLIGGMTLANRILGFVNAPALMQRAVARLQGVSVDIKQYESKRDRICQGLSSCGYDFIRPDGAFYLFPKSPIPDDVVFVNALLNERILAVPGRGFGAPGYFRLAFCVDDQTIQNAMPGFGKVMQQILKK
ncbi:MAG: pyridoxal phosphate-dependent aminotransferase [Desulfobacterales bacterium]|nr:pyridoxal phosphate-dependent aminotransferase [Desulfobacterales bacterium]